MATSVLATEFPAPGLRNPFRYITGHNSQGDAVFLQARIPQYNLSRGHLSDMARRTMATTVTSCWVGLQPKASFIVAPAIPMSSRGTSISNLRHRIRLVWSHIVFVSVG